MPDFSKIKTYPIKTRRNKFSLKDMIPLDNDYSAEDENIDKVAKAVTLAKKRGKKVVIMLGGAVVKMGCSLLIIDLMQRGFIDHIAVNGAVSIHDFEVAMIGETSEDVPRGLEDGSFGMAEETGFFLNEAIKEGYERDIGYGTSAAKKIKELDLPYKDHSLFYNALELGLPITVHVAVGGDIIHQRPDCDGAALGRASYTDFKLLTQSVSKLREGALLNIGSAVNLPEVFLKALTIVRNLGYKAENFTTANFDFLSMYRTRTRILEWPRTLGCRGHDIRLNHNRSIPALRRRILEMAAETES